MQQLIQGLNVLLPLLYGGVFCLYLLFFFQKTEGLGKVANRLLLATVLIHVTHLIIQGFLYRIFPVATVFASLSMLSLDVALLYYLIERKIKEGRTGIFFLGISFSFQLISSMFITYGGEANELLTNPMFGIHTTFTILGISALAIAALYSLMYWMLAKEIKQHRFGVIYDGLPALETLESMARFATGAGLILLGTGILLGHLWAGRILGHFVLMDPKIIVSDIAWLAYLGGWIYIRFKRVQGIRMSIISMIGFLLFFITLIAINFFESTFHKFV